MLGLGGGGKKKKKYKSTNHYKINSFCKPKVVVHCLDMALYMVSNSERPKQKDLKILGSPILIKAAVLYKC